MRINIHVRYRPNHNECTEEQDVATNRIEADQCNSIVGDCMGISTKSEGPGVQNRKRAASSTHDLKWRGDRVGVTCIVVG